MRKFPVEHLTCVSVLVDKLGDRYLGGLDVGTYLAHAACKPDLESWIRVRSQRVACIRYDIDPSHSCKSRQPSLEIISRFCSRKAMGQEDLRRLRGPWTWMTRGEAMTWGASVRVRAYAVGCVGK